MMMERINQIQRRVAFFLLLFTGCMLQPVFAQVSGHAGADELFRQYARPTEQAFTPGRPYYICKWEAGNRPPITPMRQVHPYAAIIRISTAAELSALQQQAVVAPASDHWKLSPALAEANTRQIRKENAVILTAARLNDLLAALNAFRKDARILEINESSNSVIITGINNTLFSRLIALPEVIFADTREEPRTETGIIGYNRGFHGISAVDYRIPGANGMNRVAGVKEQKMEATDLDLHKRVLNSTISAPATEYHATVISSIIGGAGNSFYDGRGIAWGCSFFPSTFANLFADDAAILNTNRVTVQNHSYGTVIQQFYGAEAVSYDAHTWTNKNFLHIFSAGNSGNLAGTTGTYANLPGFANLTGNFKTAKNILTIGAITNKGQVPAESSSGPLYDGRMAPQLVALGPNGTSDAAAVVTGTIAVMQQVYADSNSQQLPPASLLKAILYNTADDIGRAGIDHKTGYGQLNSYEAIRALQRKDYDTGSVLQGQVWTRSLTVPPGTAALKITLSWTDSTAAVNNNKALGYDADLEILETGTGTVYKPWVLSVFPHADSLIKLPVRRRDSLNTSEQVSIALPAPGNYLVRVTGTSIPAGPLPFHVAIRTDTLQTFQFTHPQHTSDVNREENATLDIRWRTFVADTNETGNLYISYNQGTSWQLLKAGHKIYTNLYQWPVRDTASAARLKMETAFGDFFSADFIIAPVTRPVVDFLCADSFRLSWNRHIFANGYRVYTLTDSPYLKRLFTVADSFVVLNRTAYPGLVYAVEPVLSNGIPATRSIAQDITQQGVKCFYRTFYYTLQDQNRLDLVLELSIASYIDSVYFERVSAGGGLLQEAGAVKVSGPGLIYQQRVNEIPPGTSYWRVRIKLKSGAVVYTEIISVLSSGKQYLLFYPNPSGRDVPITYVLQQGVPAGSRLQLFDISGRLVRSYTEMPGSIKATTLPRGLYIYKLLTTDGQQLETGKLVIQ